MSVAERDYSCGGAGGSATLMAGGAGPSSCPLVWGWIVFINVGVFLAQIFSAREATPVDFNIPFHTEEKVLSVEDWVREHQHLRSLVSVTNRQSILQADCKPSAEETDGDAAIVDSESKALASLLADQDVMAPEPSLVQLWACWCSSHTSFRAIPFAFDTFFQLKRDGWCCCTLPTIYIPCILLFQRKLTAGAHLRAVSM